MPFSHERSYYRLTFPMNEHPEFCVGALAMPVLECSERGVRYAPAPGHTPAVGDRISGVVRFKRGGDVEVVGTLSRAQGSSLVIVFNPPGIPFGVLMAEQRYLLAHYPERFAPKR
jgi:hypothetical protein